MKTIVLTGGGTAGHVTTNLSLIPLLKQEFDKITQRKCKIHVRATFRDDGQG